MINLVDFNKFFEQFENEFMDKSDDVNTASQDDVQYEYDDIAKLDLTKKEDHDKAIKILDEFRGSFAAMLVGGDKTLDTLKTMVDEVYNKSNAKKKIVEEPARPSSKCSEENKKTINRLVDEYVDTVIQPTAKFSDDLVASIKDGLFEFACWILKHE